MELLHDRINFWLESVIREPEVPTSVSTTIDTGRQRQHRGLKSADTNTTEKEPFDLPSPPPSLKRPGMDNPLTHTPIKKQKTNHNVADTDPERTPRGPGDVVSVTGSDRPDLPPDLPSGPSSVTSGQSSPGRQADELRRKAKGVLIRTMNVNDSDMPSTLREFIPGIQIIASGFHVVPPDLKQEILRLKPSRPSLADFYDHVYAPSVSEAGTQKLATDTGILIDIFRIVDKAEACMNNGMDEAGWNVHVHGPLLETAFYGRGPWGKQLASFFSCTSARILPWYRIDNISGKKVDFTLFIDPSCDAESTAPVETLFEARRSINHTDFAPLEKCPVTVSIETKRHDEGAKRANIQMGVWQAAQWRALAQLAGSDALKSLEFLPGLLVIGHQWSFVATSYKDGKTILWKERSIGSTQTEFGVFQIMKGIDKLRAWSVETFWPWYKLHVLKIGAVPAQGDEADVQAGMQGLEVNQDEDGSVTES